MLKLVHASDVAHGPTAARGPGLAKLPVPTRAVLATHLNAVLRERGMGDWSNGRLGRLWGWDREDVRDVRNGSVRLTPGDLADMGPIGDEVLARVSGRRAA